MVGPEQSPTAFVSDLLHCCCLLDFVVGPVGRCTDHTSGRFQVASGVSALNNDERVDEQPMTDPVDLFKTRKRRLADQPRTRHKRGDEPQIGRALRSVYDQTVGEAIPPEMLELLGKLG